MTAKSKWWYCGRCGFANHPRHDPDRQLEQAKNQKCEQCGALQDDDDALDYAPQGA